ncbi:MAG TPA: thioredoxin family protein [Terriglobales bacterium]|nr:thioredoxin family protein [Terriglobales bacterium]
MAAAQDEPHGPSPWWSLLLLPIAILVGWLIGQAPPPLPRAAAPATATASRHVVSARPTPATSAVSFERREPAPPEPQRASPEPPRAELSDWTTYESALSESERNGKPVLLDFNAAWCPPCRRLRNVVFDDPARGRDVQLAVIPVSIVDQVRENGSNPREIEDLQRRYDVRAFPTLVVFSPATGRSETHVGFGDPDQIVRWITEAAQSVR